MAVGSWTALCLIGGWKGQTLYRNISIRLMLRRRVAETARQYETAQREARQRSYAKSKGMQA